MHSDPLVIKKSPFQFIKLIVIIELVFALLPWLLSVWLNARRAYEATALADSLSYSLLTALIVTFLQVTILVVAFTAWYLPTYVVDPEHVVFRRGGLFAPRKLADTPRLTDIVIVQGALARRLNYGSLCLHDGGGTASQMKNVPDPAGQKERILSLVDPVFDWAEAPPKMSAAEMIEAGEGQFVEFKSSLLWDYRQARVNKDLYVPVMKNIVGFLNTGGGNIVIGVDDDAQILGLENDYQGMKKQDKDGWENVFNMAFKSMIGLEYRRYVAVDFPRVDEKEICVIVVSPANEPAYLTHKGTETFYIRAGNGSQALSVSKATQYVRSRFRGLPA